jgi:hypothetical protein
MRLLWQKRAWGERERAASHARFGDEGGASVNDSLAAGDRIMIELTDPQRQALRHTKSEVRVADPETGQQYVILFERLQRLLIDNGDWTPEEDLRLLAESGRQAGWDDPSMDVYDDYDGNRAKLCQ